MNRAKGETKKQKIAQTKEKLRNQKASLGLSKGDHRKVVDDRTPKASLDGKSGHKGKKRVSFRS